MTEILKPQVHASGLVDVLGIGVAKQVGERVLAPVVGNGTIKSGVVKLVAGGVLHGRAGRIGNIVASGLVVDAVEDVVVALMGGVGGATGQTQDEWA